MIVWGVTQIIPDCNQTIFEMFFLLRKGREGVGTSDVSKKIQEPDETMELWLTALLWWREQREMRPASRPNNM